MKKSISVFFAALTAVFLSASPAYAFTSRDECAKTCNDSCVDYFKNDTYVGSLCQYGDVERINRNTWRSHFFRNTSDCEDFASVVGNTVQSCHSDSEGIYYTLSFLCRKNCFSCNNHAWCGICDSGYYLSEGKCVSCPANATCDGTETITCDLGYTESNGECVIKKAEFNDNDVLFACMAGYTEVNGTCVKDGVANTVNSCPPEMTLSADGCCCLN